MPFFVTLTHMFFLPENMLFSGCSFPGTTSELDNARRLLQNVGRISPYPEFLPVRFPHRDIIFLLLLCLHEHGVCCFLSGGFVIYIAGLYTSYRYASMFVALTDIDLLQIIFQRYEYTVTVFTVDDFTIRLMEPLKMIYCCTRSATATCSR